MIDCFDQGWRKMAPSLIKTEDGTPGLDGMDLPLLETINKEKVADLS